MSKKRLTHKVSEHQIREWAAMPGQQFVYAVSSPWWSLWDDDWMPYRNGGLPCDPRGSMLMQGDAAKFLVSADANPEHYGRHGIAALVAAFHSNVEVLTRDGRGWRPTSLDSWDDYNALLDNPTPGEQGGE